MKKEDEAIFLNCVELPDLSYFYVLLYLCIFEYGTVLESVLKKIKKLCQPKIGVESRKF